VRKKHSDLTAQLEIWDNFDEIIELRKQECEAFIMVSLVKYLRQQDITKAPFLVYYGPSNFTMMFINGYLADQMKSTFRSDRRNCWQPPKQQ
jgi:hypothetical protein